MSKAFVGPAEAIALPVLCSSNFEEYAVRRALRGRPGLRVQAVEGVEPWAELASQSGVALVDVAMLGQEGVDEALASLTASGVPTHLVGIAASARMASETRQQLAKRGVPLVTLSSEHAALRYAVARAVIASTGDGLRAQVKAAWRLPHELRAALRGVLDRMIPGPGLPDDSLPLRQVEELASVAGASLSHFYRARREAGRFDVRALARAWLATQAVCIKSIENPRLDELARRAGYPSRSGLSALGESVVGIEAGMWKRTPPSVPISTCVAIWTEALQDASDKPGR
jgi:hypothetical protein